MNNKKIIFFDIDGTIIGEESKVMIESTKEAINEARRNGNVCIINTGRTKKLVGKDITDLVEFDGYIYGCGTMIEYHNEIIMHETFTVEKAERIIESLRRNGIDAILEGTENNYHDTEDKVNTELFREFIEYFTPHNYGLWDDAAGHFDKFYCYVDDVKKMDNFKKEFADELEFIDRSKGFFEIMPKGFSKASGIDYLANALDISMENTVAIGDSSNDVPMLERAATSIGMGNSSQVVLDMVDHVTTHVDEDGIYNALKWLEVI